jgi:hypothetical protein
MDAPKSASPRKKYPDFRIRRFKLSPLFNMTDASSQLFPYFIR